MLSIEEFGRELIVTGDLDPVYIAVYNAELGPKTRSRLCLAYWSFYHLGVSAQLAELDDPDEYWDAMQRAAANVSLPDGSKPFPRGAERRHFRGAQSRDAVAELRAKYPEGAEQALRGFIAPDHSGAYTYSSVAKATQTHRGFGPWIAWKVADMAERVLGYDVDFSNADLGVYKDPRQGAALSRFGDWTHKITDAEVGEECARLAAEFSDLKAPPRGDRAINIQECETVFCKAKSHFKGHYPLGKDTRELRHGLKGWGPLAEHLMENLPCT